MLKKYAHKNLLNLIPKRNKYIYVSFKFTKTTKGSYQNLSMENSFLIFFMIFYQIFCLNLIENSKKFRLLIA